MTGDEMRAFVDEMVEITLNQQRVDESPRYWIDEMIWHGPAGFGEIHGLEEFKADVQRFFRIFPDYRAVNEFHVVEPERGLIAAWGYFTGTQVGPFVGVPPTNRQFKIGFSDIWRFEGDKLAENWVHVDSTSFLREAGALEIPARHVNVSTT